MATFKTPDERLGQELQRIRKALGVTQKRLAEKLSALGWDVGATGIAKIETGRRSLRVSELILLADALDIPAQYLIPDSDAQAGLLSRELHRSFQDARREVVEALYRLDRLRLHLEVSGGLEGGSRFPDRTIEALSIADVVESIVASVGTDAIEAADSEGMSAEDKAHLYQSLVDRVFSRVAVVYEEAADGEHPEA